MSVFLIIFAFMVAIAIPVAFTARYWDELKEDGFIIFIIIVLLAIPFFSKDFLDFAFKEYLIYTALVVIYGLVDELNL